MKAYIKFSCLEIQRGWMLDFSISPGLHHILDKDNTGANAINMQDMACHNMTASTERHWIPGQEGKSINRGEVNSTHACLTGAQTVAMVIREGWPHFLELLFHPWIFPRKGKLILFVWLFYWFSILSFLTLRSRLFPQFQEHPSWLYEPPDAGIQPSSTDL